MTHPAQEKLMVTMLFLALAVHQAAAQSNSFVARSRGTMSAPAATAAILQPPMSDFERFSGEHFGHPLVQLTFPTVSAELTSDSSLKLVPQSLALFDDPGGQKAFAVLITFSRAMPGDGKAAPDIQSLTTYLDYDELWVLASLLNKLAATGVPPAPTLTPTAKVVVSMVTESGARLEFTAEGGGATHCRLTHDFDVFDLELDADAMKKMAETFISVRDGLHVARESLR